MNDLGSWPESFDQIVGRGNELLPLPAATRRGRVWLVCALGAGLIGVAVLAAAVLTSTPSAPLVSAPHTASPLPAAPAPTGSPPASSQTAPAVVPVAELADKEWVVRIAESGSIPPRALSAYAGAALRIGRDDPGCGLGWNTLAAIGHVETGHGTVHGGDITTDGTAAPTIVGIALDGTRTDAIADTDFGQLDGDPVWDRAVGPMQFIPSTWARYSADGNGDGVDDINNIDDAALAAGKYLCSVGGDLTVDSSWIAAVGAYNPSVEYNNRVADAADHYATLR